MSGFATISQLPSVPGLALIYHCSVSSTLIGPPELRPSALLSHPGVTLPHVIPRLSSASDVVRTLPPMCYEHAFSSCRVHFCATDFCTSFCSPLCYTSPIDSLIYYILFRLFWQGYLSHLISHLHLMLVLVRSSVVLSRLLLELVVPLLQRPHLLLHASVS